MRHPVNVLFGTDEQLQKSALRSQLTRNPQLSELVDAPYLPFVPVGEKVCWNLPFRAELTNPDERKAPLSDVSQVAKSLGRVVRQILNTPFNGSPIPHFSQGVGASGL